MFLSISLTACCALDPKIITQLHETARWFTPQTQKPRGVVLVIHGLNQRPSSMDALATYFASEGFYVHRLTLPGHNEPTTETFDPVVWTEYVKKAYTDAHTRYPHLPTYVVGFSLGGILATKLADSVPQTEHPKALILFAPALSLCTLPAIASALHLPPAVSWRTPNLAPRAYRRYPTTPAFWYSNTLELHREIQTVSNVSVMKNIPTLVFLNPRDELVSRRGIASWIDSNGLRQSWQEVVVNPTPEASDVAEHLIIDEHSLGASEWTRVKEEIHAFLRSVQAR